MYQNGDGNIIAVGAHAAGKSTKTYKFDTDWVEQGTVACVVNNDNYNVALNSAGDLLAIGAPETTLGGANNYGSVAIYSTKGTFKCVFKGHFKGSF